MNGCLKSVPAPLLTALADRATREEALETLLGEADVDLGKLWNAVGFVLEAAAGDDPLNWNGEALEWTDTGYGPPLLIEPAEVALIAKTIAHVDDDAAGRAFTPDAMQAADLYCPPPTDPTGQAAYRTELLALVRAYRAFFADAAANGHGALYYLT